MKIQDIMRAIKDIQKLDSDLRKLGTRATPDIVGFFGELLAWKELKNRFERRGFSVDFGSGQSRADIVLTKSNDKINFEVKTSRLKNEGFGMWYGVALNIKKCKDKKHGNIYYNHPRRGRVYGDFCYFDYIIFVALRENLSKAKFYIIPRMFIERNEKLLRNTHGRFSSATHRIIISNNGEMPDMSSEQKRLIKRTEKFHNCWDIIK